MQDQVSMNSSVLPTHSAAKLDMDTTNNEYDESKLVPHARPTAHTAVDSSMMAPPKQQMANNSKGFDLQTCYLYCVDIQSRQPFSVNLGTQEAQKVALSDKISIQNKISREKFKIDELLCNNQSKPDKFGGYSESWHFENETSQLYRRSMVPFYLLTYESNLFPVYTDNSNINANLTKDYKIKSVTVTISPNVRQQLNQAFRVWAGAELKKKYNETTYQPVIKDFFDKTQDTINQMGKMLGGNHNNNNIINENGKSPERMSSPKGNTPYDFTRQKSKSKFIQRDELAGLSPNRGETMKSQNSNKSARKTMGFGQDTRPEVMMAENPELKKHLEALENFELPLDDQIRLDGVSLLLTAEKLIRMIEKEIESQIQKMRKPAKNVVSGNLDARQNNATLSFLTEEIGHDLFKNLNRIQVLKFQGIDSYLYGDTQLIYFNEIRDLLQKRKRNIELFLLTLSDSSANQDNNNMSMPNKSPSVFKARNTTSIQAHVTAITANNPQAFNFPPLVNRSENLTHKGNRDSFSIGGDDYHMQMTREMARKSQLGQFRKSTIQGQSFFHSRTKLDLAQDMYAAQLYKKVSPFFWYQPVALESTDTNNIFESVPFTSQPNFAKNFENLFSLKFQNGLSTAQNSILPSCLVPTPVRVHLHSISSLFKLIKSQSLPAVGKYVRLPMMTYRCPKDHEDPLVHSLVTQLKNLMGTSKDISQITQNFEKPVGNQSSLITAFEQIDFMQGKFYATEKIKKVKVVDPSKPSKKGKEKEKQKGLFKIKPKSIQIQAALYLGNRRLSCFSYSKASFVGNRILFDSDSDTLTFYKPKQDDGGLWKHEEIQNDVMSYEDFGEELKIEDLPSHARICFNIILIPQSYYPKMWPGLKQQTTTTDKYEFRQGFVLGSGQISLFDESYLLRQGAKEIRLWPFQAFDPRMVCQGECFQKEASETFQPKTMHDHVSIQIRFESFVSPVGWRLGDCKEQKSKGINMLSNMGGSNQPPSINNAVGGNFRPNQQLEGKNVNLGHALGLSMGQGDLPNQQGDDQVKNDLEKETESLRQVKQLLDAYPLDVNEKDTPPHKRIKVETVLEYRNYINKLPILIKLIDFVDHSKIRICYESLESSGIAKDMTPEEALALLDGQFGDIRVRIFAVKKLSLLTDCEIALLMPQLIQALRYELFHQSPLAEFLLERALQNMRVVGHAFYWGIKANLWAENSRERYYLILERFLLCCGQFKNDLLKQKLVDAELIKLQGQVSDQVEAKKSKAETKKFMHKQLHETEIRTKLMQQLLIGHGRYDDSKCILSTRNESVMQIKKVLTQDSNNSKLDLENQTQPNENDPIDQMSKARSQIKPSFKEYYEKYTFDIEAINQFINEHIGLLLNDEQLPSMKKLLYKGQPVHWETELFNIPFEPKLPLHRFSRDDCSVFSSKQRPLMIKAYVASQEACEAAFNQQEQKVKNGDSDKMLNDIIKLDDIQLKQNEEKSKKDKKIDPIRFMLKCGDDLRQDNLVLQFFKLMDKQWQSANIDLRMLCYSVMETGFQTGYVQLVDNAAELADMHKESGFWSGPFNKKSIMNYFMKNIAHTQDKDKKKIVGVPQLYQGYQKQDVENKLKTFHDNFLRSLAGQCVATYVLGIRDRHPGNYMLQKHTGKFFHIDFGHFLDACKKKLGFTRDREPFIYSDELHYFMRHFSDLKVIDIDNDKNETQNAMAQTSGVNAPLPKLQKNSSSIMSNHPNSGRPVSGRPDSAFLADPSMVKVDRTNNKRETGDLVFDSTQKHSSILRDFEIILDEKHEHGTSQLESQNTQNGGRNVGKNDKNQLQNAAQKRDEYEDQFENFASKAFLKLRQNADIYINLLILMLVADLDELNLKSIGFLKDALFLDVSEEEATVAFKQVIDTARKQTYRKYDNLFHVINDEKKRRATDASERKNLQNKK